jgi:asparagine synthase (glutamine-hydrolysing)
MCGIAGIAGKNGNIDPECLREMLDSLRHRGPDDEGYMVLDRVSGNAIPLGGDDTKIKVGHIAEFKGATQVVIGQRRLSIIDTSTAGHQPMISSDGKYVVVFNGELYNYRELQKTLESEGVVFKTKSDTEILLNSYIRWGEACTERFDGMWSFVILDLKKNLLFGSRDRFGVKPLYYVDLPHMFFFASEIKALLTVFDKFKIDRGLVSAQVYDYLFWNKIEDDEQTIIKHVHELEGGHQFRFDLPTGKLKIQKYFNLKYDDTWESINAKSTDNYSGEILNLLEHSVDQHLISDVPVGSCLSGGLDSSSIVCIVRDLLSAKPYEQLGTRQKVFTACYPGESIDEESWAKMVAEETKADWHRTYPTAETLIHDLEDLIYYQDLPFGGTSIYAQYKVMELAKNSGVKVLLDGQGADELFAGYDQYYVSFAYELIRRGKISRLYQELTSLKNSPVRLNFVLKNLLEIFGLKILPAGIVEKLLQRRREIGNYFNSEFLNAHTSRVDRQFADSNSLNAALAGNMKYSLKKLLRYEDRNSMRFSIEARTPFADDKDLIEYVFGIPGSYKIVNGWSKSLLRRAVKGTVPEKVVNRRDKIGFSTPNRWLIEKNEYFKSIIDQGIDNYLHSSKIIENWDRISKSQFFWRIINFAMWKRKFRLS